MLAGAAPAVGQTDPTATGGASGFRDLLGIGQGQTVNPLDFSASTASGQPPATFVNQRSLFESLLYAAPRVTTAQVGSFFKPAGFGVATDQVESTESPRPGTTIVRDRYHVPHVYGASRSDTMFGAGYAGAADRLFFMDVLRRIGQARLTELVGPGKNEVNVKADAAGLDVVDYTDAELAGMLARLARSGPEGTRVVGDLRDYTDGVNAYISRARLDLRSMPAEYQALGKPIEPWRTTDSLSVIAAINGYFGRGGGVEYKVGEALRAAQARFGRRRGPRVLADFRAFDDPEAPVVTTRRFRFDAPAPSKRPGVAVPDARSVRPLDRIGPASGPSGAAAGASPGLSAWVRELRQRGLALPHHASNAMLVNAAQSRSGRPLFVAGPQVDFYSPPLFYEVDLHGPGIDARGVSIPGAGPQVLIGHGRDFAWTVTTAQGDNTDIFAERLCEPAGRRANPRSTHYLYRGRCIPMTQQKRILRWSPGPADRAADPAATPQTYALRAERSAHGPIVARATIRRAPVAFALARASYFNEANIFVGIGRLNGDGIRGPRAFQRAVARVPGSFNWFYADSRHTAYLQSGLYPRRANGTNPDLPAWGTGPWDWRRFRPSTFTSSDLPFSRLPQAVDPTRGYLVSWNNKQAPGWRAADSEWEYGPVHRSQRLERRVRAAIRGRRKLDLGRLVGIMGDAATVDLRGQEVLPWLLRVIGPTRDPQAAPLVAALRAWQRHGAHRRDLNRDNVYDESVAVALMDAWWTPLVRRIYEPVLGRSLVERIAAINRIDYLPVDGPDTFFNGWYGYVQKDLRTLLGHRVRQHQSRIYCGRARGDAGRQLRAARRRCRRTLLATLKAAGARVAQRYGGLGSVKVPATCPVTDPPSCDQLDFVLGGAVPTPPIPWQDRGTFQQVVEVARRGP